MRDLSVWMLPTTGRPPVSAPEPSPARSPPRSLDPLPASVPTRATSPCHPGRRSSSNPSDDVARLSSTSDTSANAGVLVAMARAPRLGRGLPECRYWLTKFDFTAAGEASAREPNSAAPARHALRGRRHGLLRGTRDQPSGDGYRHQQSVSVPPRLARLTPRASPFATPRPN